MAGLLSRSGRAHSQPESIWAIRDLDLDVAQGEVLGVIGRNGAGKSTLLKLLCRITEPTVGEFELEGRVGALLEVGTGFHPELTGRENIFLNGAILGMSRSDIKRRFDEIVDFAEIAAFLDTPVKRYSSGMHMRLGFSVAAHLEPDILFVDEVLAVGDVAFQRKCLGKIEMISKLGRTVVFVSHNMAAVRKLCTRALVLRAGRVDLQPDSVDAAINRYLESVTDLIQSTSLRDRTDRTGSGAIRLTDFEIRDRDGASRSVLVSGETVEFHLHFEIPGDTPLSDVVAAISITSSSGNYLARLDNEVSDQPFARVPRRGRFVCTIPKLPLTAGTYVLNLAVLRGGEFLDWIQEAVTITVEEGDFYGTGRLPPASHAGVLMEQAWAVRA